MVDYKNLPALLTIKKAAEVMGISRDFAYKALRAGDLPTEIIAGKRWVLRDPLLRKLGAIDTEGNLTIDPTKTFIKKRRS